MVMDEVKLLGLDRVIWNALENSQIGIAAMKAGINKGNMNFGKALVKEGQRRIKEDPKSGITYRLYGLTAQAARKRYHTASAPGESPADMTSKLRRGMHYNTKGLDLQWGYSSDTPYGLYLEKGVKGRIKKRPNLEPTSKLLSAQGEVYYNNAIADSIYKWVHGGKFL